MFGLSKVMFYFTEDLGKSYVEQLVDRCLMDISGEL